jgi:glucose-6-phosphate 1-epimerase
MTDSEALNARFALPGHLRFAAGPGGLTVAEIANAAGTARIALHGAHVLAFQPRGARPLLWLSGKSWFAADKPIRGGIPLCWPWFGAHPADPALPAHGFARISPWQVLETQALSDSLTRLRLGLSDTAASRRQWDHAFAASLEVTVGAELTVALTMRNPGAAPYTITAALHTYFAVSDVTQVRVLGFDRCPSIDTVGGARTPGVQTGPVTVHAETDIIFSACPDEAQIEDPAWNRRIRIRKAGSLSAVVWNPWIAKAKRMPDFGDDEYPGMICVETTNAPGDARTVPPGGEHRLQAILSVEPLG